MRARGATPDAPSAASLIRVQVARELWLFVAPRHRREQVEIRHDGTATLGHVVEALGVPLTEVGELLAGDVLVTPSQQPPVGSMIQVRPIARPQRVPYWNWRFVLDVHLGTLARRLRLLGLDAAYRNDADDDALIEQAQRQHRLLLTRDRGLLRRRSLWAGAYVRGARSAEQVTDVLDRFAPPLSPFTRCTTCNGQVEPVAKHEVADELAPGTRRSYDVYARCRACGQVYWHGAHGQRLDAIIDAARSTPPQHHPDKRARAVSGVVGALQLSKRTLSTHAGMFLALHGGDGEAAAGSGLLESHPRGRNGRCRPTASVS